MCCRRDLTRLLRCRQRLVVSPLARSALLAAPFQIWVAPTARWRPSASVNSHCCGIRAGRPASSYARRTSREPDNLPFYSAEEKPICSSQFLNVKFYYIMSQSVAPNQFITLHATYCLDTAWWHTLFRLISKFESEILLTDGLVARLR